MTQEEFGFDLFQAIKTIGSILALQDQYAGWVNRKNQDKMQEILTKRDKLKCELQPQLEKLSDADLAEIARRYKWVMG